MYERADAEQQFHHSASAFSPELNAFAMPVGSLVITASCTVSEKLRGIMLQSSNERIIQKKIYDADI